MSQNSNYSDADHVIDIINQDEDYDEYENALLSGSAIYLYIVLVMRIRQKLLK